jgi:putative ATPase
MRPRTLKEFAGQAHLMGEGKLLRRLIEADRPFSAIFFGPPGTGKTSLVQVIAALTARHLAPLSAVTSNVAEVKDAIFRARNRLAQGGAPTTLFIDEFHRFNRAQQEVLLPHLEEGLITFIGLTTFNPFFALAPALLSRTQIFEFKPLAAEDLALILRRALEDRERGLGESGASAAPETLLAFARLCEGDSRRALAALETAVLAFAPDASGKILLTGESLAAALGKKLVKYDRDGDGHYDTISAFIKSLRGSDPDAALYWLAAMLAAGEDPRFIARRLVILASEDVGNADPRALAVAVDASRAVEFVGMPEARLALAQTVTYLACAPKSNASYQGLTEAMEDVEKENVEEVPAHLKDAGYAGAKRLGRGEGYRYPHAAPGGSVPQEYRKGRKRYYRPTDRGYEATIRKLMAERMKRDEDKNPGAGA